MTVKRKGDIPFAGIVVAGNTTEEAVALYKDVAKGNDVQVVSPKDATYNVATASSLSLSNPLTGKGEMVQATDFPMESMSFSQDDQATVEVEFTVCAGDNGCGKHIIAESSDLLNFCPSCSAALPDELPEEVMESLNSSCDECEEEQGYQGVVAIASSKKEAVAQFAAIASGTVAPEGYRSGDITFAANSDAVFNYDPFNAEEATQESLSGDFSVEASADQDEVEAHYYQCSDEETCGMHVVASTDAPVFCGECGSILLDPEDVAELDAHASTDEDEDEDEDEDLDGVDDLDDLDDEDDLDDLGDDDLEDEDDEDLESDSSDLEDDLESESADLSDDLDDLEIVAGDDEGDDDEEDEDDDLEDDEDEEDDMESESSVIEELDINLLNAVASQHEELEANKVFVVNCGNLNGTDSWCAFYGNMPIALATVDKSNENVRKIFSTNKFHEATARSVKELGVEEGLRSMGFNAIAPEIDLNVTVEKELIAANERKLEEVKSHFEGQAGEMKDKFGAALATASMGINRNFFKGLSNPISASLIASLSAAGVANPEAIVNDAFAKHSDGYNKAILEKAMNIFAQSPETQNQLAEAVASANFVGQASAQSAEQRLSEFGTVVASNKQKQLESQSNAVSEETISKQKLAVRSLFKR